MGFFVAVAAVVVVLEEWLCYWCCALYCWLFIMKRRKVLFYYTERILFLTLYLPSSSAFSSHFPSLSLTPYFFLLFFLFFTNKPKEKFNFWWREKLWLSSWLFFSRHQLSLCFLSEIDDVCTKIYLWWVKKEKNKKIYDLFFSFSRVWG
jgi:hypothetical protein